jgi:CBS domain-containing protein
MRVEEIMTRDVVTIRPHANLREAATILVDNNISGLPVCGAHGELVGIVSEGDIVIKEAGPRDERRLLERFRRHDASRDRKLRAVEVKDAMTESVVTISPYASVAEAARRMADLGIKRLPVMKDGKLVGILSRTDLVRAFVRGDDEVRDEIREDVLRRTLWLEVPEAVEVDVRAGVVRLSGEVDTQRDADLVRNLVSRVPGVVSVDSDIGWKFDDAERAARERSYLTPAG